MTKLIVLFIIGQLFVFIKARPAPEALVPDGLNDVVKGGLSAGNAGLNAEPKGDKLVPPQLPDLKRNKFDAFGAIDNGLDPFGPIEYKTINPYLRHSRFDAFGAMDDGFDPYGPIDNKLIDPYFRNTRFDAFGPVDEAIDPLYNVNPNAKDNVILPKIFTDLIVSRSGGEYFDSSSSFDIYNDLVYGPDFIYNAPFFRGRRNPFGPMFPFAADESFELLHPVVNFAESLEDIDSYFGDESRDLFDYFGGNFDKGGDAGQFGNGNLLSFFSQIYDGPFFHSDDMMIL